VVDLRPANDGRQPNGAGREGAVTERQRASAPADPEPPSAPAKRVRPPRTSGPVVVERDKQIITWVALHGIVTPDQIARHFFTRDDKSVGKWAAYRRVKILVDLGLLQRDTTFWRQPSVLRVTSDGARLADVSVNPANLVLAEVRHSLAVVDLVEDLLSATPEGTTLVTERQLRAQRRRDMARDRHNSGAARIPDAELVFPSGSRIAVELDLTSKRSSDYEEILKNYLRQKYDAIWWYVAPGVVPRLQKIVKDYHAEDLVTVDEWRGDVVSSE
jgi:hypothetical protein